MTNNDCGDLKSVDNNKPEDNQESASPTTPGSILGFCKDMALDTLVVILIIVYSIVFHERFFRYMMRRAGLLF